ncbi:MAG: rod shape-determining protein RodA [Chitinophagales bacterium]|nr:rod shape-determining protein RodA [Chitinophagales bacterium]HMV14042.1 rod shape-determining protein RodA [Chitinophagales bacterium]HMW12679.1 rod shape-determining protein RodA [Chitinophagales bacterium]HMX60260.1 rod shape-determining protein RodA [Chitinophagales bacterium]HMZ34391.1 rod shape-determining protein RodA [Chitinophagales bacterium]
MQANKRAYDPIDSTVLYCYLFLVILGIMSIFATEYNGVLGDTFLSFKHSYIRQAIFAIASGLMFFTILGFDRRILQLISYPMYGLILLLLLSVFVFGERTKGDQNWINLGFFKLQPSEFAKFATAMALAKYFDTPSMRFVTRKEQLTAYAIIGLPLLMVMAQGDAGSSLVFAAFIFVLNREGLSDLYIYLGLYVIAVSVLSLIINQYIIIGISVVLFLGLIYWNWMNKQLVKILTIVMIGTCIYTSSVSYIFNNVLEKHQRDRINVILGKELTKEAKRGVAYNLNQSKIAIGSGGIIGKGYLQGTQTRYNYVPETSTDFIFSAIGEEWGFLGAVVLIFVYTTMLLRLLWLAERQRSPYGRVYIYSVVAIIFTHVVINIGMTIGLLPVIGIPLPLLSYGGSSLLSFTFMIATALKLDSERRMTMR